MTDILHFHGHRRYNCPDSCEGCHTCNGGLFSCTRCGGAEGTLPTDCPGALIHSSVLDAIHRGSADFRWREGWVAIDEQGRATITIPLRW